MPITCTANDLLPLAAVMRGMSEEQRNYVNTYLLALAAGVDPDPNAILAAANCFRCVPEQKLKEMSAWLICSVAGGVTPPTVCDQVLSYVTDPTAEGKVPANQNSPAVAYQEDGLDATYTWNTTTHVWQ